MNIVVSNQSEIKTADLHFLWIDGYYDGVLSGFASLKDRLCYFSILDDPTVPRRYSLHSLTDQEAEDAVRNYKEFKGRFGDHCDLSADGSHAGGKSFATIETALAYQEEKKHVPPVSYDDRPIIGWFSSEKL